MWWKQTWGLNTRSQWGLDPAYPIISTSNPSLARERAWYCIRGLLPMSPRTTMHALLGFILQSWALAELLGQLLYRRLVREERWNTNRITTARQHLSLTDDTFCGFCNFVINLYVQYIIGTVPHHSCVDSWFRIGEFSGTTILRNQKCGTITI